MKAVFYEPTGSIKFPSICIATRATETTQHLEVLRRKHFMWRPWKTRGFFEGLGYQWLWVSGNKPPIRVKREYPGPITKLL